MIVILSKVVSRVNQFTKQPLAVFTGFLEFCRVVRFNLQENQSAKVQQKPNHKMKKILLPLFSVTALAVSAQAQTWTASGGGNWSDGLNWSTTPTAPANDGTAAILFNSDPATDTSTVDTNYSILSLTFGNSAGPWTIGNSGGAALTIGSGGITHNGAPASGGVVTLNVPITIGANQTWNPGTFNGVNRQVTVNGTITGTSDKLITVSGSQAATLYRKFVVSGNNSASYAGNWTVGSGGRLGLANAATATFGSGTITVNSGGLLGGEGGTATITNAVTLSGGALGATGDGGGGAFSGNINISADSQINLTRGSAGPVLSSGASSVITGSGNLTQNIDSGTTTRVTTIGNTGSTVNNTNVGTLIINAGVVELGKADNTNAWGGNVIINNNGQLRYNSFRENQIADTATVTINSGGSMNLAHDNAQQLHEKITGLVVNASSNAFINDTSSAGTARIIVGSGTSGTGTGGIFVNSTGSLSGNGTVNKATTIAGGVLSAGNGDAATLSFSQGLTLATGLAANSLQFTLGTTSDQISITNGFAIGAGLVEFDRFAFTAGIGFGAGTYTLFSSDAAISGTLGANLTGTIGGLDSTLSISGNNLIVTVVPEPSSFALLACGLAGLVALRRRRA